MTSQINPSLINGQFPVQGIDNPSQGLRTNFTNTQLNFSYAAAEISDLQNKAILKSPLNGSTANNSMNGTVLQGGQLQDFAEVVTTLGTQSGPLSINYASGHYQVITTGGGPLSIAFTNWPASGSNGWVTILFKITDVSHTITFPNEVQVGDWGIIGYNQNTSTFTAPAAGAYEFTFTSYDGGFTVVVHDDNTVMQPLSSSIESITASGASSPASLAVGTTAYTTTAGLTYSTLAAGVEGQVKVLALYLSAGSIVVQVASAGWLNGGTGTITLNNTGDTVTLKVINGRWFCIGKYGAATIA